MTAEAQTEVLNQAFGYEIATLLMNEPMSRSYIQSLLPYEQIHDTQLERIIDACYEDGIIEVANIRGPDHFKLDESKFTQGELENINRKALARITNPASERGKAPYIGNIPEEFFIYVSREEYKNNPPTHTDFSENKSMFSDSDNNASNEGA